MYVHVLFLVEVSDLHNFVNVALHTAAGEGDLSSDKLSHLQTVGSGFGPLIYGLKTSSGFGSFQKRCKAVWKAMEKTPNLPQLLVSCKDLGVHDTSCTPMCDDPFLSNPTYVPITELTSRSILLSELHTTQHSDYGIVAIHTYYV